MSKPKAKNPTNSLARYRAEVKGTPFVLWLDEDAGEKIEVPRPSGDQMLDAEAAMREGTSRDVIEALCGDTAEELLGILGGEDAEVLRRVCADMQRHFGLGE